MWNWKSCVFILILELEKPLLTYQKQTRRAVSVVYSSKQIQQYWSSPLYTILQKVFIDRGEPARGGERRGADKGEEQLGFKYKTVGIFYSLPTGFLNPHHHGCRVCIIRLSIKSKNYRTKEPIRVSTLRVGHQVLAQVSLPLSSSLSLSLFLVYSFWSCYVKKKT